MIYRKQRKRLFDVKQKMLKIYEMVSFKEL